jgi:hypothetical protein
MKTLTFLLLAIVALSCSEEEPLTKKQVITFNVVTPAREEFTGTINWGVNALEYSDRIRSTGYASSFEIEPNDIFLLNVASDTESFQVVFFKERKLLKTVTIKAGEQQTFNW